MKIKLNLTSILSCSSPGTKFSFKIVENNLVCFFYLVLGRKFSVDEINREFTCLGAIRLIVAPWKFHVLKVPLKRNFRI